MLTDDPIDNPLDGVRDLIDAAAGAASFAADPFGSTFRMLQDAAHGLTTDVVPALTRVTSPDLSADWFIDAYRISFAAALLVAVLLILPQFVQTARGRMAGRDLVASAGGYFVLFLLGGMFGPLAGILLTQLFHTLSNSIIAWAFAGTVDDVAGSLTAVIDNTDPGIMTGGVFAAILLMLAMVVGLLIVLLTLVIQLVTLYFIGVLIPLGLVWIIDPARRGTGTKLLWLWLGILASHPLLFFLLGVSFHLFADSYTGVVAATSTASTGREPAGDGLQMVVNLLVAVIALFMATLSPLLLMKFAQVIPAAAAATPAAAGVGGTIGAGSLHDVVNRMGSDRAPDAGAPSGAVVDESASGAPAGGGRIGGSLAEAASAAGSAETAGAAAGGAAAASAGGAEALAAAGVAESATGAGAAIGVPTIAAAAATAVVDQATQHIEQVATAPLDDVAESTIGSDRL